MGVTMFNMNYRAWRTNRERREGMSDLRNGVRRMREIHKWVGKDCIFALVWDRIYYAAIQELARRSFIVEVRSGLYLAGENPHGCDVYIGNVMRGEYGELLPPVVEHR